MLDGFNVDLKQSSSLAVLPRSQPGSTGNGFSRKKHSSNKKKLDSSTLSHEADEDGQLLMFKDH